MICLTSRSRALFTRLVDASRSLLLLLVSLAALATLEAVPSTPKSLDTLLLIITGAVMSLSDGLRLLDRQHQHRAIMGEWTRLLRDVSQDEAEAGLEELNARFHAIHQTEPPVNHKHLEWACEKPVGVWG